MKVFEVEVIHTYKGAVCVQAEDEFGAIALAKVVAGNGDLLLMPDNIVRVNHEVTDPWVLENIPIVTDEYLFELMREEE